MSERESSYLRGFLTGLVLGGLAGAITALLLAPKSGKELRSDIRRRSEELYTKARELFENTGEEVSDIVNEARHRAQSVVQTAREQAHAIVKEVEQAIQEAQARASAITEQLRPSSSPRQPSSTAGEAPSEG